MEMFFPSGIRSRDVPKAAVLGHPVQYKAGEKTLHQELWGAAIFWKSFFPLAACS